MSKDKKKNILSNSLIRPISNEKWQPITIPLVSILISFIAAADCHTFNWQKSLTGIL